MDCLDLSLGPATASALVVAKRTEDTNPASSKKRKHQGAGNFYLDWEQCHDHQGGRVSCLNRKDSQKRSCNNWQKEQKLDLELNISSCSGDGKRTSAMLDGLNTKESSISTSNNTNNNMVAMGCFKCNLLVMLSKSFPSCPNCKYVHPISMTDRQPTSLSPPRKDVKSFDTLSLLN